MDRVRLVHRFGFVLAVCLVAAAASSTAASFENPPWLSVGTSTGEQGSFEQGWASADGLVGSAPTSLRVDDADLLTLRGTIVASAAPADVVGALYQSAAFRMPCQIRPPRTVVLPTSLVGLDQNGPSSLVSANLIIDSSGSATVMVPVGPNVDTSTSPATMSGVVALDGMTFEAAPVSGVSDCDPGGPRVLWVAPDGDDAGPGTETEPLATVGKAVDAVRPGDTIRLTDGVYSQVSTLHISKSGTAQAPITLEVAAGDSAEINGAGIAADPQGNYRPILDFQATSHWNISGIELADGPSVGVSCTDCTDTAWADVEIHDNGDHGVTCGSCERTTWTRLDTHHNAWAGLQLVGAGTIDNLVEDSDFHDNRDPQNDFENADGLDIQIGSGTGNVVRTSRSWGNADDGFDLFGFEDPVTLTGNWSFENGVQLPAEAQLTYEGDGQGYKLGGNGTQTPPGVEHVLTNNMAWRNAHNGFHSSGQPGPIHVLHNTAFENGGRGFNLFATDPTVTSGSDLRNNLSYANLGTAPMDQGPDTVQPPTDSSNTNSWTLTGVTINDDDFLSLDSTTAEVPRGTGGALPTTDLLALDASSGLVDSATVIDASDPYPDYGARPR